MQQIASYTTWFRFCHVAACKGAVLGYSPMPALILHLAGLGALQESRSPAAVCGVCPQVGGQVRVVCLHACSAQRRPSGTGGLAGQQAGRDARRTQLYL